MEQTIARHPSKQRDPAMLVRGVINVASLPTIYTKLSEAIADPRKNNKDFTKIINEDTAMAARLLRIANSALYNFPSKVDTVTHAITIIGTNQLRDLVLACSVIKLFQNVPEDLCTMESFWRHSVACGVCARVLAGLRREQNVERFFVAGLLHDIGRLIMFSELSQQMNEAYLYRKEQRCLLFQAEREIAGFDHATLGGLLLKAWQLPARLEEAVTFHHAPHKAKKFPQDAAILHVADILAHALQLGSAGENCVPPLAPNAWEQIDLPISVIGTVMGKAQIQYNDAVSFILAN